ncbi:FeoC-like transcriptional regulator [Azomonas agilis]|uniref:FeoC-like transcriptional regulator n=1 Tax=Azomonas agilis TaxID=116849 RepID=A0A562HZI0_9GAMM|nr:FeoC-like transcriptional regulator [Azomonas agilis]TWH63964.1 FeoC-like transcriptional regulator [Azomonas agilis]
MSMLSALNETLRQQGRASLVDLAHALNSTPEAVEPMLQHLERKGRARKLPEGTSCNKPCCSCNPATLVIYEWVDSAP